MGIFLLIGFLTLCVIGIVVGMKIGFRRSPYDATSMEEFSHFLERHQGKRDSADFRNVYVRVSEKELSQVVSNVTFGFVAIPLFFIVVAIVSGLWRSQYLFLAWFGVGMMFFTVQTMTYIRDISYIRSRRIPLWILRKSYIGRKYILRLFKEDGLGSNPDRR